MPHHFQHSRGEAAAASGAPEGAHSAAMEPQLEHKAQQRERADSIGKKTFDTCWE